MCFHTVLNSCEKQHNIFHILPAIVGIFRCHSRRMNECLLMADQRLSIYSLNDGISSSCAAQQNAAYSDLFESGGDVEKTVRIQRAAACLTASLSADTVANRKKGRLKFLYSLYSTDSRCQFSYFIPFFHAPPQALKCVVARRMLSQ